MGFDQQQQGRKLNRRGLPSLEASTACTGVQAEPLLKLKLVRCNCTKPGCDALVRVTVVSLACSQVR